MLLRLNFISPAHSYGEFHNTNLSQVIIMAFNKNLWRQLVEERASEKEYGLINEYSFLKGKTHLEPTRKGTPKGYKIGFTRTKEMASILVGVTNLKIKKIAESCEVSYGLLRKWKTEDDFKSRSKEHCQKFAEEIVKRARKEIKKDASALIKFIKKGGDDPRKLSADRPLSQLDRVLIDAKNFSEDVFKELDSAINRILNKAYSDDEFFNARLSEFILNIESYAKTGNFLEFHEHWALVSVNALKNLILEETEISDSAQRTAMVSLDDIERRLKILQKERFPGLKK